MRWFRRNKPARPGVPRESEPLDFTHLEQFVRTRRGVEAYVEPLTSVTQMTVVLIAHDGEWTRRRIGGPDDARKLGQKLGIPVYDVAATGYPNRMREWSSRQKRAGQGH